MWHCPAVPVYRFYTSALDEGARDSAILPNDEAALMHAYGFMDAGANVDVWERMRHVAHLWGERRDAGLRAALRLVSVEELQDG